VLAQPPGPVQPPTPVQVNDARREVAAPQMDQQLGKGQGLGLFHPAAGVQIQGRPLGLALCDSDSRAASGEELRALGLEPLDYYWRTGCPFVSFNGMAKILWARFHHPELYRRAAVWLSPQDYLLSLLMGRVTVTAGSSARTACR